MCLWQGRSNSFLLGSVGVSGWTSIGIGFLTCEPDYDRHPGRQTISGCGIWVGVLDLSWEELQTRRKLCLLFVLSILGRISDQKEILSLQGRYIPCTLGRMGQGGESHLGREWNKYLTCMPGYERHFGNHAVRGKAGAPNLYQVVLQRGRKMYLSMEDMSCVHCVLEHPKQGRYWGGSSHVLACEPGYDRHPGSQSVSGCGRGR